MCPQLPGLSNYPIYKDFTPTFSYSGLVNEKGVIDKASVNFNPPKRIPLPPETINFEDYDLRLVMNIGLKIIILNAGLFIFTLIFGTGTKSG